MKAKFFVLWGGVLAVMLALGSCKTVQTTQPGVVGVDRKQSMLLSSNQVNQSSQLAYQQELKKAAGKNILNRNPAQVARVRAIAQRLIPATGAYAPAMARLNETLQLIDPEARFIRYRGIVPHEEMHGLYAVADINVFASSCENMPNILLEGMASGLPIACSNRGPMPEVLGDAGVYFDPEQPDEIAEAIRTLIESSELRLEKAQAAYERAQQFSWARCADETLRFLAQIYRAEG